MKRLFVFKPQQLFAAKTRNTGKDMNLLNDDGVAQKQTMQVQPVWALAIPLPGVIMITVSLYMMVLGLGLWIRSCLKGRCSSTCSDCCPNIALCEQCFRLAEMCDCQPPTLRSCLPDSCPSPPPCVKWDCACTCQPPECDSCNCLCFEIRIK